MNETTQPQFDPEYTQPHQALPPDQTQRPAAPTPPIANPPTAPGTQPGYYRQPYAQSPHPATPRPPRRRRTRRSLRRGCACGPSCLLGCVGVIVATMITMLLGTWVAYGDYSRRLEDRLDEFDQRLVAKDFQTTYIYDRQGRELYQVVGQGRRERIPLEQIPDVIRYATIALEDDTFYSNIGIDLPSIIRATYDYMRQGQIVSGASTITQQLVRDVLFEQDYRYERTLKRKVDEALLAIVLTQRMSKDEILELYLNEINYGNLAYGIEAAAKTYFGKSANELQLHEAALLAGLPQAPLILNPLNPDPEIQQMVIRRQHLVLDLMVKEGYITEAEALAAKQQPLIFVSPDIPLDKAPHFVVYVQEQLLTLFAQQYEAQGYLPEDAKKLAERLLFDGGLQVYTSIDLDLQAVAEEAASRHVAALRQPHNLTNAAVVALDPTTGEILAMVGSVNFDDPAIDGQVNVAVAKRQPGSTMKPFTYSAAFEQGWVPASVIWDTNVSIGIPGQPAYEPVNYDRRQHGPVHVRDALANSYNIPAVQTLRAVGVQYLIDLMHRFGVKSLNRDASNYGLSLTLGGGEVTLLELTNAYGVFARGGFYVPPRPIICILDSNSNILYEYEGGCLGGNPVSTTYYDYARPQAVLDPRIAFVISDIMADNAARSPAMGANSPLNTGDLLTSVKTGTTNDFRDNWTVGYTNKLVVGVWSGNSNNAPMNNISGLQGAAPIWRDTILGMYAVYPFGPSDIPNPGGLYSERICNVRFLKDPAESCGTFRSEWFFDGVVLVPNSQGQMVPAPQPLASQPQPPSQYGPQLEEVQPGIIRTYARPLTPDQSNWLAALNPGSAPQKYCLVPIEIVASVPDARLQLFIKQPSEPEDARRAYQYAHLPDINYAILPQFACTPETISGSLPTVSGGPGGEWEVNPVHQAPYRTAAVYCRYGNVEVYAIVGGGGVPAFTVTAAEIAAVGQFPPTNTLIREGQGIRLYRLTSGELQVNAPLNGDPNGYVVIWGGC